MVSTRLRAPLLLGAICLAWVALGAAQDPAPSGNENEKTLYANSQETFNPGFRARRCRGRGTRDRRLQGAARPA